MRKLLVRAPTKHPKRWIHAALSFVPTSHTIVDPDFDHINDNYDPTAEGLDHIHQHGRPELTI